ncbi:hypothetical protein K438DRAFT_2135606 [Mycena galopus ATCC 62051]|nr:hypothetical protein K438DRAFT_2135606 [Mycena galopus ATCC 62051]
MLLTWMLCSIGASSMPLHSKSPAVRVAGLLYYFDRLFTIRVTEACEVNKFGTSDGDIQVLSPIRLKKRQNFRPGIRRKPIYGNVGIRLPSPCTGSALQANILAEWRRHFIIEEAMLEVDTRIMTPAPAFETSGHVARFADWMVKDKLNGEVLRADHLVKNVLEARGIAAQWAPPRKRRIRKVKSTVVKLDDEKIAEYESILAQHFNLMFASSIGHTGQHPGFLRPETAQGHFINLSRPFEFNNGRVPFTYTDKSAAPSATRSPRAPLPPPWHYAAAAVLCLFPPYSFLATVLHWQIPAHLIFQP